MSEEMELRERLQNAVFALEYWHREARVCGKFAKWIEGPMTRGLHEITEGGKALSRYPDNVQGDPK